MTGNATLISPTEDQIFDTVWGFVSALFDPSLVAQFVKANQNGVPTPTGTYVIFQPGQKVRTDQGVRLYVQPPSGSITGSVNVPRGTIYSYQLDCYGPGAPDWADTITVAWRSMWACDWFAGGYESASEDVELAATIAPLYADEPVQLNIANAEQQYEQRYMCKLYLFVDQVTGLTQTFFETITPTVEPPVDIN